MGVGEGGHSLAPSPSVRPHVSSFTHCAGPFPGTPSLYSHSSGCSIEAPEEGSPLGSFPRLCWPLTWLSGRLLFPLAWEPSCAVSQGLAVMSGCAPQPRLRSTSVTNGSSPWPPHLWVLMSQMPVSPQTHMLIQMGTVFGDQAFRRSLRSNEVRRVGPRPRRISVLRRGDPRELQPPEQERSPGSRTGEITFCVLGHLVAGAVLGDSGLVQTLLLR